MKKKVNDIVICKDQFKSKEEFEDAIKRAVMVLLENNYIMTILNVLIHYKLANNCKIHIFF